MSIFVCMRVWMLMCVWVEFKFAYRLTFIGDPYALKHAALMQWNIYIHMDMYVCMCISVGWWFVHSCGCVCVRAANACCCGSFTFNEIIRQPTIHGSSSKCQRRIAQFRVCLLSQPPCAALKLTSLTVQRTLLWQLSLRLLACLSFQLFCIIEASLTKKQLIAAGEWMSLTHTCKLIFVCIVRYVFILIIASVS